MSTGKIDTEPIDKNFALTHSGLHWFERSIEGPIARSRASVVRTVYGIVSIEQYKNASGAETYLEIVLGGRLYQRRFRWWLTDRSVVIRARRFASEVWDYA